MPSNAFFSGLLLLPMTIAIGMTYPLAVRVLARDADDAAPASARVFSWNTVGAILGSLAAAFVAIPALKYEGAIRLAVFASAALGIAAFWVLVPLRSRGMRMSGIAASVLAVAACAMFRPQPPLRLLVTSPLAIGPNPIGNGGRILHYDVGRSASVVVLSQDGGLALRTNGLPEALMDGPGAPQRFSGEYWLSPLAALARPDARDMLVVGFGGGGVIEAMPPSVERIDVIELEPKVIEANRATAHLRKRDPLLDRRVNIIVNDARGALNLTRKRYDAIISQPSHPWTAGASHLYTREFMQLAHEHLEPGGVFVQWMNVIFMDEAMMRSLTATLLAVFPEVRIYRPDPETMVFLASDLPMNPERYIAETGLPLRQAPLHYARFGINALEDVVNALVVETDGARRLASGAAIITDDDNRIATSNVFEKSRGMSADSSGRLLAAHDPLQRPDSMVYTRLAGSLSFPYLTRRNGLFSVLDPSIADRVARMSRILGASADGEYARAQYYRILGQQSRSQELLRLAIDEFPDADSLRTEFLRDSFAALASGQPSPEVAQVASKLDAGSATVLEAARRAVKGEWAEVARLDGRLAEVGWKDAWHAEALALRVNWRIRVTNEAEQRRFADEAIGMLDRINLMNPTLTLFGLRARAGLAAGRPDIVVESLSNYARLGIDMTRMGRLPGQALASEAQTWLKSLDSLARDKDIDAARLAEVRAELSRLLSN